jgi:hypothetical protein
MQKNSLKDISFGSYSALSVYIGLGWGVVLGLFLFVAGFLSDSVGSLMPHDLVPFLPGNVVMLFLAPILMGVVGLIIGWASFPFFRFLIHATDGINLECEIRPANPAPVAPPAPAPARSTAQPAMRTHDRRYQGSAY